ncbi:MAG: vanadium-dependent haloperoxidase [Planctomycetota bacterium]|nr:vanadium-dependent haloperoxidase [Planctomycetota bacterium]
MKLDLLTKTFSTRSARVLAHALPVLALTLAASCSGGGGGSGSDDGGAAALAAAELAAVKTWNTIAIDATGLDHMPSNQGPTHTFAQQMGPGRSSRAEAIVHVAIFEAVNAIKGGYESYAGVAAAPAGTSVRAAVAQAAHDALVAIWPSQVAIFDGHLASELAAVPDGASKTQGIALGQLAAARILFLRASDGSSVVEPMLGAGYSPTDAPGEWRQDPIAQQPVAMGAFWGNVKTFVIQSKDQFPLPPPPAITSTAYAVAFGEVKALGGDGITTPTVRTTDQTQAGIFWAYDGVPSLCAPPRLFNQIAVHIAEQRGTDAIGLARLLALVNVALADGGIAGWHEKFRHKYWRPVCGIRESDVGTGLSGLGDGNPGTEGDIAWRPLGAPASNINPGTDFTPPFPAYPSGHATFGGTLFQILRRFYNTDHIPFTFVSDEYNGVTADGTGSVRPLLPRSFANLSQAEEENGQSRVHLGIHWSFDKTGGILLGNNIGNYVYDHAFQPVP